MSSKDIHKVLTYFILSLEYIVVKQQQQQQQEDKTWRKREEKESSNMHKISEEVVIWLLATELRNIFPLLQGSSFLVLICGVCVCVCLHMCLSKALYASLDVTQFVLCLAIYQRKQIHIEKDVDIKT